MSRKRTVLDNTFLIRVEDLSSKGASKTTIAKILDFSPGTYTRKVEVMKAFQRGESKYRNEVIDIWHSKKNDINVLTTNVKRLNIHLDPIIIKKPETVTDAKNILAEMIVKYTANEINGSQLKTVDSVVKSFVGIIETQELEKRIQELEQISLDREEKR